MINGSLNDFLDNLFIGIEMYLKFHGSIHFIQGYWKDDKDGKRKYHLMRAIDDKDYDWEVIDKNNDVCVKAFLSSPIWDGKKFLEIEDEIEWVEGDN